MIASPHATPSYVCNLSANQTIPIKFFTKPLCVLLWKYCQFYTNLLKIMHKTALNVSYRLQVTDYDMVILCSILNDERIFHFDTNCIRLGSQRGVLRRSKPTRA